MNLGQALARAKQVEDAIRERALLPINLSINGIEVRQFTLEHWMILSQIRSPFFTGQIPDVADIGLFLWVVSPEYDPRDFTTGGRIGKLRRWLAGRRRRAFLKRIVWHPRWLNFEPGIRRYIKRAFMDRPASSSSGKAISAGLGASMVHRIAYAYGWDRDKIMQTPLTELFQYLNWIGANQPQFKPLQDAVVLRFYDREEAKKANRPLNGVEANGR